MSQEAVSNVTNVLVLLSGGLDSSACVEFFCHRAERVEALFIDYGQAAAAREQVAATSVARYFQIPITTLTCTPLSFKESGVIIGRNAFLIFSALLKQKWAGGILCIGIHAGTNYWDCTPEFVASAQSMLDGYTDGRVRLSTPLIDWSKQQIWDFCKLRSVPIELTYSCELGNPPPCGQCESCADRQRLLAS